MHRWLSNTDYATHSSRLKPYYVSMTLTQVDWSHTMYQWHLKQCRCGLQAPVAKVLKYALLLLFLWCSTAMEQSTCRSRFILIFFKRACYSTLLDYIFFSGFLILDTCIALAISILLYMNYYRPKKLVHEQGTYRLTLLLKCLLRSANLWQYLYP